MIEYVDFSTYLYEQCPTIARIDDQYNNFTLKRYLGVLGEFGIQKLFNEIMKLYDIWDLDKCPAELLPDLAGTLGFKFLDEIPSSIQRRILSNLIELYKRKGTYSCLNYIAREIMQVDTHILEMQYRIFRTWSSSTEHAPITETTKPKTMSMEGLTEDTYCLFSSLGKYNKDSISVIVNSTDMSMLKALSILLKEFTPIFINIFIQVKEFSEYSEYVESINISTSSDANNFNDSEKINLVTEETDNTSMDIYTSEKAIIDSTPKFTSTVNGEEDLVINSIVADDTDSEDVIQ